MVLAQLIYGDSLETAPRIPSFSSQARIFFSKQPVLDLFYVEEAVRSSLGVSLRNSKP